MCDGIVLRLLNRGQCEPLFLLSVFCFVSPPLYLYNTGTELCVCVCVLSRVAGCFIMSPVSRELDEYFAAPEQFWLLKR